MIRPPSLPLLSLLLALGAGLAQQTPPPLNTLEKEFQETMSNVILSGRFTRQDGTINPSEDKYTIEKATKVKDDIWRIDAHVKFGGQEMTVPVEIHVRWAGDTPVLTLTDESVAGMGKYTVRILIYHGSYAGAWSNAAGRGGLMFGSITKAGQ